MQILEFCVLMIQRALGFPSSQFYVLCVLFLLEKKRRKLLYWVIIFFISGNCQL